MAERLAVRKEIEEVARQQGELQSTLADDEKAILVMARQMDEDLRAKVRSIRLEAEERVAQVHREVRRPPEPPFLLDSVESGDSLRAPTV